MSAKRVDVSATNAEPDGMELAELRQVWHARRTRMQEILRRFDPRGMTRPARDPSERRWLDERQEGWFVEDEDAARAARAYYVRKYQR